MRSAKELVAGLPFPDTAWLRSVSAVLLKIGHITVGEAQGLREAADYIERTAPPADGLALETTAEDRAVNKTLAALASERTAHEQTKAALAAETKRADEEAAARREAVARRDEHFREIKRAQGIIDAMKAWRASIYGASVNADKLNMWLADEGVASHIATRLAVRIAEECDRCIASATIAATDRAEQAESERATLRAALVLLLADVEQYPAYQRPVHAVEIARAALATTSTGEGE